MRELNKLPACYLIHWLIRLREKLKLESDVTQEEATMRLKQSEIKSMMNETETLHQMVRQLDNQKTEARKRLDDLGSQVTICYFE